MSLSAAFFDVDGTLVRTNIVHYYAFFRERRLHPVLRAPWRAAFLAKCLYYLALDRFNRSRLNVVFYRNYAGMPVSQTLDDVEECFQRIIRPNIFSDSIPCLSHHRAEGRLLVLVSGSLDFILAPLGRHFEIDHILAAKLHQESNRFTGELDGGPLGDSEKSRRMREFAREHDVDLDQSFAYGDSNADIPMLEVVGHPIAVNPDRRLAETASERGWHVERWNIGGTGR
jgi:HAD superfamily hydrolase (TIGR01490 family)